MSHAAALWTALCIACCAGRAHAQAGCGLADFYKEIIVRQPGELCPEPAEPPLDAIVVRIDAEQNARLEPAQADEVYRAALRDLKAQYASRIGWGAALAQGVDVALRARPGDAVPPSDFANVRVANPSVDPDGCAFVTGVHGAEGYACFALEGLAAPASPSDGASMTVHVLAPLEAAVAFRVLSVTHSAISKLKLPAIDRAIERLRAAQKRFDNLRRYGYLQYPWELAIDSALAPRARYEACQTIEGRCDGDDALDPDSVRAIFLHPGVGIAASGFGDNGKPSADTAIALSLEAAGAVFYNASFEWYLGASAGAIVNDGDFRDPRLGLFVHVTRWVHAGYLMSFFRDESRYDASIYLSMDLGTAFGASFIE